MNVVLEAIYTLLYVIYAYCEAAFRLLVDPAPKSVQGQVVLITGGAQGIGRQTALQLASRGATIVLWDIDQESLKATSDDLRSQGRNVHIYKCDVSSFDDVKRAASLVRRDVGDVDILINNAGLAICKSLIELSEKEIQKTMGVNTMAHFWTLKEFLPAMMTRNKGHFVTISSYAGLAGSPIMTDYTASKFAVRGLADAVDRELRQQSIGGVKSTTVFPLFTNTALVKNVSGHAKIHQRFGRLLEPEEVAASIVDGILKNKREVYIPGDGRLIPFIIGACPWKARQALSDFIDCRFTDTKK